MTRRRWISLVAVLLVAGAGWLIFRDCGEAEDRKDLAVVRELGGHYGWLSAPFSCGKEYAITFEEKQFTNDELHRLEELRPLTERHYVTIIFTDTNVTAENVQMLRGLLPECHFSRSIGGELHVERKTNAK